MTQQGGSWLDRFEKFGDKVAGEVANAGRQAKAEFDRTSAQAAQQQAQSAAERHYLEQRRWERANSPTWAPPTVAADTTEWATYELVDPRSGLPAVSLRHPADWKAGGAVTWPAEPGILPRYSVGSSPAAGSCVAERFPRFDFLSGPFAGDVGGRFAVPATSGEELVATQVVPRLRGGRPNLLVVGIQRVDPGLWTGQPLRRELGPEAYLASVEYERDGVPWADEMLVLRYSYGDQGPLQPFLHGCSVWSLNASQEAFPDQRSTLRAIAVSSRTHPEWDAYAAQAARAAMVP